MISTKKLMYQICTKIASVDASITNMVDTFYPVGSYYETSDTSFDPNTSWGGEWSLEAEGLVHIGAGSNYTIGATGGEATHTLTDAECALVTHNHTQEAHVHYLTVANTKIDTVTSGADRPTRWSSGTSFQSSSAQPAIYNAGTSTASSAHNNMQPYVVVNRWHRTA